jgi:cell division protein ZapA (FtsZ GTPase activity inhibitor)
VNGVSVEVSILGCSFTIQSNYDPRYMSEVVACLKEKIREVQTGSGVQDPLKIALLAALNVVDELLRKRGDASREIEEITERLIERIDQSLVEN